MDCPISNHRYEEALQWLYSQLPMFSRIGAPAYKPGLKTTERLDSLYGHPHRKFKAIHVAGTNGKGSTSHMIASVLQAQGYKTALYTSPHLTDFRERMRINGKMIPKDNVVRFVNEWREKQSEIRPSFFELTMMMAFDWFASEHVDYAVIEVGMGGRLDSTNIIHPLLSVITNISFDHTQFLGSTLKEIAGEKAGIIKTGVPVVIGEALEDLRHVFEEKAIRERSPIYFAEDSHAVTAFQHTDAGWKCSLPSGIEFTVPLSGQYQKKNIFTAICALEVLKGNGIQISENNIQRGLENVTRETGLRGRWQKMGSEPDIICDTGHNIAGIKETMESLSLFYPDKNLRFIIGFVNDKDVAHIVDLFPDHGYYYFTQAAIPRAMAASEVSDNFAARGISGKVFPDVAAAFTAALSDASPSDVLYVGGSTFIVADFLAYIDTK